MKGRVIVLGAGTTLCDLIRPILESAGYEVGAVGRPADIDSALSGDGQSLRVVIFDACLPGWGGTPRLIRQLRHSSSLPILQISGCEAVDAASRCQAVRADRFLVRPFPASDLVRAVDGLADRHRADGPDFHGMYGRTRVMREVFDAVLLVAGTDSSVLITGETGTGKEMVARAIHACSNVSEKPFVPIDCGSLPESLLTSELFGHVKGAFTGATVDKAGLVEAANGGTIFLDEVGNMPPGLQMALLRALQEHRIRRVGSTNLVEVDMRVIAATNLDLAEEVRKRRFREDLYYRLNVFPIDVPPLREHAADIDRMVAGYLGGGEAGPDGHVGGISAAALALLRSHEWPGNVRELYGVLEGARIRACGDRIRVDHLPPSLWSGFGRSRDSAGGPGSEDGGSLPERQRILLALEECDGNRTRAAGVLGIGRTTLWRRMRALDIHVGPG